MSYRCYFCGVQRPEEEKPTQYPSIELIIVDIVETGDFKWGSLVIRTITRKKIISGKFNLSCPDCVPKRAGLRVERVTFEPKALEGRGEPKETLVEVKTQGGGSLMKKDRGGSKSHHKRRKEKGNMGTIGISRPTSGTGKDNSDRLAGETKILAEELGVRRG